VYFTETQWLADDPFNVGLNDLVERTMRSSPQLPREHVGASVIGHECERAIQYARYLTVETPARVRLIFQRGHAFEALVLDRLKFCGFRFAAPDLTRFQMFDGAFGGTADGVIVAAPAALELATPCVIEIKALNNKNFHDLSRNGLARAFPRYWVQVAVYQRGLGFTNPALFIAVNADTCETLYLLAHFNADLAEAALKRAERIIAANRDGRLLPRAFASRDDWRCQCCQFTSRCWGAQP
jgi:hypothetical protein